MTDASSTSLAAMVIPAKTCKDVATYDQPHQYSPGVRYLFVNGKLAIDQGRFTGTLAGRVLRHDRLPKS